MLSVAKHLFWDEDFSLRLELQEEQKIRNMNDRPYDYWVYIMASKSRVIYIGVTNSLERRVWQHKLGEVEGFTKKYNCTKLVWHEHFRDIKDAIACEKRLKGLLRAKKVELIEKENPNWRDLSEELFQFASED